MVTGRPVRDRRARPAPRPTSTTGPTSSTRGRRRRRFDPIVIAGAEGSRFWDDEGNSYLDFSSQLVNVNIGHQHPKLVAAIKEQADKLCTVAPIHANDARSEAARLIGELAPGDLDMVFFTNGGAEATENAIRMARLHTGRHKVLTTYRSYHGATAGGDHDDRRPPPLGQRAGHARRRQVLGAVHVPLGVPRRRRRRGVRSGRSPTWPT